jgi:hypothetical protein
MVSPKAKWGLQPKQDFAADSLQIAQPIDLWTVVGCTSHSAAVGKAARYHHI